MCVEVVEVNAEMQVAILLPYQYHCVTPCTLARPVSGRLQHLLQVASNLFNKWQHYPPKLHLKESVICHLYPMLSGVGTAQFCRVQ